MNKALFILSFILLFSCSRHNDAERFLTQAQAVMEASPDSAAMYLDSILMPEKFLKKDKYMEYLVTKVQAKYKNYDNIKEDTNIFQTKAYFNKKVQKPIANSQSLKYQMYSYLYSGCVYDERGEYENAMKDYKTAFTLAENMHDSLYMWRINNYMAEVFSKQTYWDEALNIYKKSIRLANNDVEKSSSYSQVARLYYISNNIDSAIYNIEQAIKIAEQTDDENIQSQIYQNAYVFYKNNNEGEIALKYLNMSVGKNRNYLPDYLYNLNFMSLFLEGNNTDSVRIYANKLRNEVEVIEASHTKVSICNNLTKYYSSINMYDSALYFQKELSYILEDICEQNLKQNIYEIQQKYDHELYRNVYQKKLNIRLMLIICILVISLSGAIIAIIIIIKLKRRETMMSKHIDVLNGEKKDYDKFKYEIKESLNNSLKERFKIIKEVNNFEHNNRTKQNVKEIKQYAYGSPFKTAFEASEDVIESSYSDITSFIKKTFPELNETEYKVCLLSVVPISVDDIANIIELSVDSVGKARTNIRKKLKIENKRTSFSEYILEKYYQREV